MAIPIGAQVTSRFTGVYGFPPETGDEYTYNEERGINALYSYDEQTASWSLVSISTQPLSENSKRAFFNRYQ